MMPSVVVPGGHQACLAVGWQKPMTVAGMTERRKQPVGH